MMMKIIDFIGLENALKCGKVCDGHYTLLTLILLTNYLLKHTFLSGKNISNNIVNNSKNTLLTMCSQLMRKIKFHLQQVIKWSFAAFLSDTNSKRLGNFQLKPQLAAT
jgi:hypothetical protein